MTRVRKISLAISALLLAVCLSVGLASCGSKDTEPKYGYGEEGLYYYSASETEDYMLTLGGGVYTLVFGGGLVVSGAYECDTSFSFTLFAEGETDTAETGYGIITDSGISLTWEGRTYLFLTYEYYAVSFTDGGTTLSTQSVLNGKAASDPGEPGKEGYVFLGWYADSAFTTRYEFNTSVTSDTTVYARFVKIEGTTEYKVTYDFGNGETLEDETLNGRIYDLPESEKEGYTFIGWWVSATNNADELTYRYTDETLCEDTTLFAVFASGSYIGASIKEGALTWLSAPASEMSIIVTDETGVSSAYTATATSMSYALPGLETGKYTVSLTSGGITETLTYVSNGLYRVSGYTLLPGSIIMYYAVPGAEKYYVSVECGNPSHDHTMVDNGRALYYDVSNCEMPAEGITVTVVAVAEGRYYSVSSYNYFLGLDTTEIKVEDGEATWERVALAQEYEVYVDGTLVATTSDTSYSLSGYGTGTYKIAVRPVTTGYYSEMSETVTFTKTTLASPTITGIADYTITWTPVEGATGYTVSINGVETTVGGRFVTSLILSDDNYTEGLDEYEISVKALAEDSANDSPYGETITVTGTSVGSAVSYSNGTVTWQYSLSASEYRITVNDGDETIVTGTNSSAVTLTKSGNNEIRIYFMDDYDEIYGTASVNVYAYAIVFDARGGTAYMDGEPVDTIYVAKGDTVTLPTAERGVVTADFVGWYTLPVTVDNPDATDYEGEGVLFADGSVFTGNSTIVLYACWLNPRLTVKLDAGIGTVLDGDGNTLETTVISLNGRSYTIEVPECDDKAYAFYGWYSGERGTGVRYTDEFGDAYNAFDDITVTTLYAFWAKVMDFEVVTHDGVDVASVSKGDDIDMATEITVPETYVLGGKEYVVAYMGDNAFSECLSLETINMPDTMAYFAVRNGGYEAGSGALAQTESIKNINVYATGDGPTTTKEITYYSEDGVLFWINPDTGIVELLYYPYGRTDASYTVPETVSNEYEYEWQGLNEVPVVRSVTGIGESAFRGHSELVSMTIPAYITTIGTYTFYYCTSLTGIDFEAEVEVIEQAMFYGCTSLASFEIPYTVKTIEESAFRSCESLTTVTVPDSVEEMGTYVFASCSSLRTAYLSNSLGKVNDYTFYNDQALEGVDIPYGVEEIGTYVFYQCYALKEISIPDSVTAFGTYTFYRCTGLETIRLSANLGYINDRDFYNCTSLKNIEIPYGVTSINTYAFYGCSSLVSLVIPDSVTELGTYAFYGCSSLETVTLSSNLTKINERDFYNCYALRKIVIPEGVTSIEQYAFYQCNSLESVTLPSTLTTIVNYSFQYCYSLNSITIPESVTSIGNYAFRYCYTLVDIRNLSAISITAGKAETSSGYIGENAKNVYTATEGESHLISRGDFVFVYDDGGVYYLVGYIGDDTAIMLPDDVDGHSYEIYQYAFYKDAGLEAVEFSDGVTAIGKYAFHSCESLKEAVLPSSLKSIGTYAFYECFALESVYLSEGLETIEQYAFYGCTALKSVTIPSTVSVLANYVFYACTSLESVYLSEGLTSIGSHTFQQCISLASVVIPDSVKSIDSYAFGNCHSLVTATIGAGITSIGTDAFRYDYKLVEIYNRSSSLTIEASSTGNGYVAAYAINVYTDEDGVSALVAKDGYSFIADEDGNWNLVAYYGTDTSITLPSDVDGNAYAVYEYAFYVRLDLTDVTVPEGVTEIGEYAFYGCKNLKTVSAGAGVTSIGAYAFYDCSSLESITLSEGLVSIGTQAFFDCSALAGIDLPSTVETIDSYAFNNCKALETVGFSESLREIGEYAFQECSSLKRVDLPEGLEKLGAYAFSECASIEGVTVPSTITTIGTDAFSYCESLTDVTLGNGLTTIGSFMFAYCYSLEYIDIPSSVTEIQTYAFYYDTALGGVRLRNGLVTIGNYAFAYTAIADVTIPSSVDSIGGSAFQNCTSLVSVTMSNGLTTIGDRAFMDDAQLKDIVLPDGIESIGRYSFSGTAYYKTASSWDRNMLYMGTYFIEARTSVSGEVVIKDGTTIIADYAFYGNQNITSVVIPDSVTHIGNSAFYNCQYVTSYSIGRGVESIGNYAFYRNYALAEIAIPASVSTIGNYAFQECTSLTSVSLPESMASMGTYCFYGCTSLKSVVIPYGVTELGNYFFGGCTSLTSVTIPETVTTIGQYVFQNCTSLKSVDLPSGLTSLGNYAFNGASALESIVVPDGVDTISSYTFQNCSSLKTVTLGSGLTTINNYAFSGCTSLESIVVPDGVTTLGNSVFAKCESLKSVAIPDSVTSIGTYLFQNATGLETVTIGSGVTSISNYDFDGCSSLKYVIIPDTVTEIGTYVFRNCTSLEWIVIGSGVTSIGNNSFNGCSKLSTVYYAGASSSDWNKISIGSTSNSALTAATRYYYSATEPTTSGNWWHYDEDGNPVVW